MAEDQREEFEKWAVKEGFNISRFEDGYNYGSTDFVWKGWQAAINSCRDTENWISVKDELPKPPIQETEPVLS